LSASASAASLIFSSSKARSMGFGARSKNAKGCHRHFAIFCHSGLLAKAPI
jgi:hypothetical protein